MIEKAVQSDIEALIKLKILMFKEGNHSNFLDPNSFALIMSYYRKIYSRGEAQHFIFRKNNKIVSCAGGFIKSDIPYCFRRVPFYGFIGDVYTIPAERNKGYALLLTNAVINWLKEKGVAEIHLLAFEQARHMYEKMGFCYSDEMILIV